MLNKLQKWATGRNVIIFVLLDVIFMMGVMPYMHALMTKAAGKSVAPIDLSIPTWTPEQGYALLDSYGEAGRSLYLIIDLTADVVYPIIYGIAFALLLTFLVRKIAPSNKWLPYLAFLPLLAVVFDYAENATIITMLNAYPEKLIGVAKLGGIFTLCKWVLVFATIGGSVIGLIVWGIKGITKR
ncbi:hypothetical protein [Haliscomenobacter sp.]|uniref:hypothetical protein n=1 Tax=Haliscomenobacter sp. TaxID=2717303 RepID=UPI0035945EC9